jgi:hypothetical protein
MCGAPIRDRTAVITAAGVAGGAVAVLVLCLRIISRLPCVGGNFGMDDCVMILVLVRPSGSQDQTSSFPLTAGHSVRAV